MELFEMMKKITRDYSKEVNTSQALEYLRLYKDALPEEKDEVVNKAIALLSMCEGSN